MALIISGLGNIPQAVSAAPTPYTWDKSEIAVQDPSKLWVSVATSADGVKLAAVTPDPGYIYSSADSGLTWLQRDSMGSQLWSSITSSADGTKLAATVSDGSIFTSTDSGATWTERTGAGAQPWSSITSSDDGTKLAAATNYGSIFTSTDSGAAWNELTTTGVPLWSSIPSITSSDDGAQLAAVVNGGSIFTSTDSGATWTERVSMGQQGWVSITSSADGTKLAAATYGGSIYTSTDSGGTWAQQATPGSFQYGPVVMARAGNVLYVAGNPGKISYSADMGATWIERKIGGVIVSTISHAASSADGTKIIAATAGNGGSYNQQIYTSQDGGTTWSHRASAGDHDWQRVLSSADGTRLVAVSIDRIFTSSDSGATWTERLPGSSLTWRWYVAGSGDGLTMIAVASDGYNYKSTDGGDTWSALIALGSSDWRQPAVSSDGTKIVINDYYGGKGLYVSTDSGATWVQRSTNDTEGTSFGVSAYGTTMTANGQFLLIPKDGTVYISEDMGVTWLNHVVDSNIIVNLVAASADGSRLMVGDSSGPIYISNDYGATWGLQTIPGLPDLIWRSVFISADGSFGAVLGSSVSYFASSRAPANDVIFHFGTLNSTTAPMAIANATLSVASSPCSNIDNASAAVFGSSGLQAPDSTVSMVGGIGYTLTCSVQGASATATITLGENYTDLSTLRVYKKASNSSTLVDITKLVNLHSSVQGNGSTLTAVSYTLTDGGAFDEDGVVNGVIVDPIYIGIAQTNSGTLANTGDNIFGIGIAAGALITVGVGMAVVNRYTSRQR